MTDETELIIKAGILQVLLACVAVAMIRPHITPGIVMCALMVFAAELAIYNDVRELRIIGAQDRAKKRQRGLPTNIWR